MTHCEIVGISFCVENLLRNFRRNKPSRIEEFCFVFNREDTNKNTSGASEMQALTKRFLARTILRILICSICFQKQNKNSMAVAKLNFANLLLDSVHFFIQHFLAFKKFGYIFLDF